MTRILARAGGVKLRRVQAFALAEREPPTTIQLWNVGDNGTDYGTHVWNERSVKEVVDRYNERGNPILVDVEHNGPALADGVPAETGGYATLEIRDGAPWLNFQWSSYGADQIASGQRRFLSPEYDVDPDSGEITRLYRVSLVADPGTYRARVLASSALSNPENMQMDPTLAAIKAILDGVSDPAEAIASINSAISSLSGSADEAMAEEMKADPVVDPQPAFAAAADKGEDGKAIAAAAAPAPAKPAVDPKPAPVSPVVAAAPKLDEAFVRASSENAKRSEDALRDILLEKGGHRLQPSVRTWASSQSLAVVRGLIAAAPEAAPSAPVKVSATRGAGHGTGEVRVGLKGAELEDLQKSMGTFKASTPKEIHQNERGEWVFPTVPPSEYRAMKAAAAAKAGK